MSSILTALKKLEHEGGTLQAVKPIGNQRVDVRKIIRNRSKAAARTRRIKTLMILLVLVLAAGGGYWKYESSLRASSRWAIGPIDAQPASVIEDPQASVAVSKKQVSAPSLPAVQPQVPPPAIVAGAEPKAVAYTAGPGLAVSRAADEVNEDEAGGKRTKEEVASGGAQAISEVGEPEALQGADLKIQAIAWSADPGRSLAVVNGAIVHEGETVSGYRVMQINENDIHVKVGDARWKMVFRRSQN